MDIRKAVGMIPILKAANPASLAALIPHATLRRPRKGEHLYFDKDEVRYTYFLVDGAAALYKLSVKQEKRVISVCGAGAFLNMELLDKKPSSVFCELLSHSWVLCFERERFLYICQQDSGLAKAVMDSMALKIRRLYRQIENTANTVRGDRKIAAKLWKLSKDHGVSCERGVMIGFDLTITYLADLLGSKRETVSRQLKILTEKGLIIIEKNRFIIPDRDRLKMFFIEA